METKSPFSCRQVVNHAARMAKGHPIVCIALGLTLAFATVSIRLLAQQSADTLEPALALYQQGELRQAQALFAAVNSNDVAYATAQAYDALCRYEICRLEETNGYSWFLNALKSPTLQQATLSPELREDLAFKEIDARYRSRLFGSIATIPLIASFQQGYPTSAHAAAMTEFKLAAWFERGMQRLFGASLDDTKRFRKTWTNGIAHLEQFLSLTKDLPAQDYAVLTDRSLAEDLQIALALMSQEPGALAEIPVRDAVNRQRYGLIRVALHQKLHPEASEQNLQLLADASVDLQKFPASRERARMKRQLAGFAFRTGERFCAEAAGMPPTDLQTIAAKRTLASRYFQSARAVHSQMAKLDWSSTSPTDTALFWMDLFNSYHFERDYAGLMTVALAQLTNSAPGKPKWLAAKIFQGVALNHQDPPQRAAAAAAFEEVMSYGLDASRKRTTQDHLLLYAARWRIHLALTADDHTTASNIVQWVAQSAGDPELKEKFLTDHRWVAKWVAAKRG